MEYILSKQKCDNYIQKADENYDLILNQENWDINYVIFSESQGINTGYKDEIFNISSCSLSTRF